MNIKKEIDNLRDQIHKAHIHSGTIKAIASNEAGPVFSEELHKLATELETLALQARILDETCFIGGGDLVKRPYNKHWDAGFSGLVDHTHVDYVFECMDANVAKIRNIRAYMLTSLYRAPVTIEPYYRAEVNHDLGGR